MGDSGALSEDSLDRICPLRGTKTSRAVIRYFRLCDAKADTTFLAIHLSQSKLFVLLTSLMDLRGLAVTLCS